MNRIRKIFMWMTGVAIAATFISFALSSCKKTEETKAFITVNDSIGNPVEGASVTLWQDTAVNQVTNNKAIIRVTKTTDSGGGAEFVFALEAYLNITAQKGNKTAHGFVRLKEHETVNQTIHF